MRAGTCSTGSSRERNEARPDWTTSAPAPSASARAQRGSGGLGAPSRRRLAADGAGAGARPSPGLAARAREGPGEAVSLAPVRYLGRFRVGNLRRARSPAWPWSRLPVGLGLGIVGAVRFAVASSPCRSSPRRSARWRPSPCAPWCVRASGSCTGCRRESARFSGGCSCSSPWSWDW